MNSHSSNATSSASSATDVHGSVTPRLWTPPLRELTEQTTYGYEVIDFAKMIGLPLLPWQEWLVIHMGELLPDGRPRFRQVLVLVARQNGKTTLSRVLILWWLFIEQVGLVVGAHAARDKAKREWQKTIALARTVPMLAREIGRHAVVLQVGEEDFTTLLGSHYRFGAANRRLGRGDTVHRLMLDELREHKDWTAYNAGVFGMNAVSDAQAIAITNQGDMRAVVLDSLRDEALQFIETGQGDSRLFLAEWSAPSGAEITDPAALAAANPGLGDVVDLDSLVGAGMRAERQGGEELAGFRTEVLCQRVLLKDPAIDPDAWKAAGYDATDPAQVVDLGQHRGQLVACLDVALDGSHATLVAAAVVNGKVYVEVVARWLGRDAMKTLRAELPEHVRRMKPRRFGWFPGGPAAAVAAALKTKGRGWPPAGVRVTEIIGEVPAVCMGLAEQVAAGEVAHPRDEMLDAHVGQTQKLHRAGKWIFTRVGVRPIDATYALAGAVHLARTLPAPLPPLSVSRV